MRDTYEELVTGIETVRNETADLRVSAESPDGLIIATVTSRGELVDLAIDPRVYRSPASTALAEAILDATRQAAANARHLVFARLRRFLPADATFSTTDLDLDPFLVPMNQALSADQPASPDRRTEDT
ncbi:hypothetical protein CFP75_30685 [Amycolatopsis alba DSM 44262]|uniref:YbaB/EbfC family DNA-binding protein n=2 Tax=Amycolatopsis alba TaxID=76020 RepID=A0A229RFN4_AMYAL|nr:hypothetical protein CFP75_30685 [Amycolatopsis alba DSM 44262]